MYIYIYIYIYILYLQLIDTVVTYIDVEDLVGFKGAGPVPQQHQLHVVRVDGSEGRPRSPLVCEPVKHVGLHVHLVFCDLPAVSRLQLGHGEHEVRRTRELKYAQLLFVAYGVWDGDYFSETLSVLGLHPTTEEEEILFALK